MKQTTYSHSWERLATAMCIVRPQNGFITSRMIMHGWTAQPDYRACHMNRK